MQPTDIAGCTHVFMPPAGQEDKVAPLKVIKWFDPVVNSYVLVSEWCPTAEERADIAAGGNVHLHVLGEVLPPVALMVKPVIPI